MTHIPIMRAATSESMLGLGGGSPGVGVQGWAGTAGIGAAVQNVGVNQDDVVRGDHRLLREEVQQALVVLEPDGGELVQHVVLEKSIGRLKLQIHRDIVEGHLSCNIVTMLMIIRRPKQHVRS